MEVKEIDSAFIGHAALTTKERQVLASKGQAMPDGSYPIRNRAELKFAILGSGRAKNLDKVKAWIIKRAKDLNVMDEVPKNWLSEIKQSDISDLVDEILEHHGVKGQRWGVRRNRSQLDGSRRSRVSTSVKSRRDRNASLTRRVKSLNDDEIKKAISRMELEKKFVDLSRGTSGAGKKYTRDLIENSGKTAAGAVVGTAAAHFVKKALSK